MADYDLTQGESVPEAMKTKYEDMGDGVDRKRRKA